MAMFSRASRLTLLLLAAASLATLLEDYPLSENSVVTFGGTAAAGSEAVFRAGASSLTIKLGDDSWVETMGEDNAASTALLAALVSVHSEPTGWNGAVLPLLDHTRLSRLDAQKTSLLLEIKNKIKEQAVDIT